MTNILLSCENEDKRIKVSPEWSFSEFRSKVRTLFSHLPENYSITDGDFIELNERTFREIQWSRLETWCLVRSNQKDSFKLDKPHYELMRYDVHPNALTQSGNYHFSSPYQAFCEFVDNSIQATGNNSAKGLERKIQLHIFPKERLAAIFDNGEGMSYEGLKAFATYFLSQADRGLEKSVENSPAYLDGLISKFGVGATQAGFFLGDRIKVVTKRDDCPFVTEIVISKEKLHQRAKENKPVFEDYRCIRNPGDTSTLTLAEEKRCLRNVVLEESKYTQFTMVILTGIRTSHISYIKENGCLGFCRSLSHVYHYYLFGEQGRSGRMKLPPLSGGRGQAEVNNHSSFQKVDIDVLIDESKNNRICVSLKDISDDLESLYHDRAKEWFPFTLSLKLPGFKLPQTVQGVLMYFPHHAGQETLPRETTEDDESEPVFECFWQGRLAPLSYVHRLDFCACMPQRSKKQKDLLPSACFKRIKGILFFNRHTPISNNKLKILLDERKDLSTALEDASTDRRLPQEFRAWLEKCHRELDKEVAFESPLPATSQSKAGNTLFSVLKLTSSGKEKTYREGDIVKLDTKPVIFGKVVHFVKAGKRGEIDKVVVLRQPAEVYVDQQEERPIARILEIPDQNTLKKVFNAEKQLLPKTVKVYKENLFEELPNQITWIAGEGQKEMTGFWVKVFSGERPPKPMVSLHQRKLSVRQVIEGPQSMVPIQNDQPFDGDKFGFKPFWISVAGAYTLKYVVLHGDRELCSTKFAVEVKANVAVCVRLLDPGEREIPTLVLGEPGINFKLGFVDLYNNATKSFSTGDWVRLEVTCPNLRIQGAKEKYKANENGEIEVSGLALEPRNAGNSRNQLSREQSVRVNAVDVGDVIFPVKVRSGPPHSIKLPQFETNEVHNYDEFPEFTVQVLDQWGQPCSATDKRVRLHADCEGFHQGPHLAHIERGQACFGPIKVKIPLGSSPCTLKVKLSFVTVENNRRKSVVCEVLKELNQFSIKVLPSTFPHKICICDKNRNRSDSLNGVATNGVGHSQVNDRKCLEMSAPAGAILTDLFLEVFDESGRLLSPEELQAADPKVTTSWSGEVPTKQLPQLPKCPVATLISSTFVGNVTCTCQDVTCQSQIRIRPLAVDAEKWAFVAETKTVEVECGTKKQLSQRLKVVVRDRFGNPAECPSGLKPSISLDSLSERGGKAAFEGDMVYKAAVKEFGFTADSVIFGCPGVLTLSVYDKHNVLSRDAQKIVLKPGPAHHIELSSPAFDKTEYAQEHSSNLISNCYLGAHIVACVCDRGGNKTSFKTTLGLAWVPSTSGQQISKKTNQKGEAIFQSNVLRCTSKADKDVKIKVSSTEHRGLQAAIVNATVQQCNHVKAVVVKLSTDKLHASNNFPQLRVDCQTEDGVRVDALNHLTVEIHQPDDSIIRGSQAYRKPVNREGIVLYQPLATRLLQQAGQWAVSCRFTEYRDRFKAVLQPGDCITQSSPVKFSVQPADPKRLGVWFSSGYPNMLSASSTADARGRTILPRPGKGTAEVVEVHVYDGYENLASVSCLVDISIRWPSGPVPENVILPILEGNPVRLHVENGVARLPKLTLASRVGNYIGEYLLVFSSPSLENFEMKFSFSTDEHIQKIQNEMTPLKKRLSDLEFASSEAKRRTNSARAEYLARVNPLRSAFRGEPRKRDVITQLEAAKKSIEEIEATNTGSRRTRTQGVAVPARIRQYIKGTVAELAFVSDPLINCLLSWFLQHKMSVALTTTSEQQRKVYDAGFPSYCEATLFAFSRNNYDGSSGARLPIELPKPPATFNSSIEFAVNLLEFSDENARLRCSLYWALLGKTIVLSDLKSGQIYREHLVRMKQQCPTILTKDGNMIASDGLMDPKRRCPESFQNLKMNFGELPPCERAEYRELRKKVKNLEMLQTAMDKLEDAQEATRLAEDRLKQERSSLSPQISALERELRKLRSVCTDKDSSEPVEKRRKR